MCDLVSSEVIAALLGSIAGFLGSWFVSVQLFKSQRTSEAAAKFRQAFCEEIAGCKNGNGGRIKEVAIAAILKHESAVILYEPFIPKSDSAKFTRVWDKYCESLSFRNINDFSLEPGIGAEGYIREVSEAEQRRIYLSFYNELISFAKVK